MNIHPERLKALRARARLSQEGLAERTRLSKRQIQRLERAVAPGKRVHERTIDTLAKALSVDPAVLAGTMPIPPEKQRTLPYTQLSVQVRSDIRLAYDLAAKRYGVTATTIANVAPLFFALMAEASLNWRRGKLRELEEASERMRTIGNQAEHLPFAHCVYHAEDGAAAEEESINRVDLFFSNPSDAALDFNYNPSTQNPFANYLRKLAADLDRGTHISLDPYSDKTLDYGALDGFPHYTICVKDLLGITGGSVRARHALESGAVRLSEIPEFLLEDDKVGERTKWLEDKVPEDDWQSLKDLENL